ncbi:ESCO1/2 acetyl-transferase domain-containing protein [Ditylenchus destructor]|nr:ESCO1/2 acetyl-transferase domain-containing protein [Ditylenchus destructor]
MQDRCRLITDFFRSPLSTCSLPSTPGDKRLQTPTTSRLNLHSPRSDSRTLKRRSKLKSFDNSLRQTIIDAGQKKIGLEHCLKCGMVYNVDDVGDVQQHESYHNRFTEKKCFRVTAKQLESWKESLQMEAVSDPLDGVVFRLNAHATSSLKRKLADIVENYVNEELGYCPDLSLWDEDKRRQALVFVVNSVEDEPAFVGAIVLIDPVNQVVLMPYRKEYCGKFLGINRIWVHSQLRRKGLATFLLDAARRLMINGGTLPKTRIAFSEPTESGVKLAISYVGDEENGRYITYTLKPFVPMKNLHIG